MPIDKSNGMSPELIQDLSKALEAADKLMKEQEKALAKILEVEGRIVSKRAESLDAYTEGLNKLTKQYEKDIDGYFSALETRLTGLYKKMPSGETSSDTTSTSSGSKRSSSSDTSMRGVPKAVQDIRKVLQSGTLNVRDVVQQNLLTELITEVKLLTGSKSAPASVAAPVKAKSGDGSPPSPPEVRPDKQSVNTDDISITLAKDTAKLEEERIKNHDILLVRLEEETKKLDIERRAQAALGEEASNLAKTADLTASFKLKATQNELNDLQRINEVKQAAVFYTSEEGKAIKEAETARKLELEILQKELDDNLELEALKQKSAYYTSEEGKAAQAAAVQRQLEQAAIQKKLKDTQEINKLEQEILFANSEEGRALQLAEAKRKIQLDELADTKKLNDLKQEMAFYASAESQEAVEAQALRDLEYKTLEKEFNLSKEIAKANAEAKAASSDKGISLAAKAVNVDTEEKATQELAKRKAKWEADEILKAQLANGGKITKEELARIKSTANEKFKLDSANLDKITKEQQKADLKRQKEEEKKRKQAGNAAVKDTLFGEDMSLKERIQGMKDLRDDMTDSGMSKGAANLALAAKAATALLEKLEDQITKVASYKGEIDTRLQGSKSNKFLGSYWDQLTRDMMKVGAVTPFFKQEKFAENIKSLVNTGIAFDLKQRAFLMTIQEKIANTFNVADGTLLRLIRIQQEDSTAGRLGMESALNSFLNEMYENTEYLKDVASSVRGSLLEMEALMEGKAATEVEYQVQKWMGSLYSVGMSQDAVQGIANALGQIAAGQIDGLTGGSGAGNLLVMAANESGKSIAEILTEGLNADETNDLLQATVNYLADIAESTAGNNVVQQQIAGVFGVKASDLRAATNLRSAPGSNKNSISDIHGENLTYSNMLNQLYRMAGSMYARTSIGEMMQNVWDNGQYTLASSMANNPISYLTYKIASLMDATVGGIPIPSLTVMMNGVDLETTVTDIMRLVAVGGGVLGSLGSMISGLGSSFSGKAMLRKLGIEEGNSKLKINARGGEGLGAEPTPEGNTLSESGLIGNSNGNAIKDSTMQAADDDKKKLMVKAKEEEPANQIDMINSSVLKIYEILDDVAKGTKTLRVRVDNYGLTGDNKSNKSQGGVNGLSGTDTGLLNTTTSYGSGSTSSGTNDSFSSSNGINSSVTNLGGWTIG